MHNSQARPRSKAGRQKRLWLVLFCSVVIGSATYFGYRVHQLSEEHEQLKADFSTVNNVSFGLLSVNAWRDQIVASVKDRIENLQLDKAQRDTLRTEIEKLLHALINRADSLMMANSKGLGGLIKKAALKLMVNEDKLHDEVPEFASKIMAEIEKPSSKQRLAYLAKSKLEDLGQDTYDSSLVTELDAMDSLYHRYGVSNRQELDAAIHSSLKRVNGQTYRFTFLLLATIIIMSLLWWPIRKRKAWHNTFYLLSILLALVLLLVGLTTTMIEIDAQIKSLDFHLLGDHIRFENQVLFYQSKSIVDVVSILIDTGHFDSILVGILILCFSILFPIAKLSATALYLMVKKSWAKHPVVRYFAFESGKWSMADVTVVAILMAYIGFNGIMNDQLADLNIQNNVMSSISTNNTSLLPGYIVFVSFVLYGLLLSQILKWLKPAH